MKRFAVLLALGALLATGPAEAQPCTGDCGVDGRVTINELIAGVNAALGATPVETCVAADADGDGSVSVAELVTAVNNALQGCGHAPTSTSTPPASATPTVTPTLALGPVITFLGVISADDSLQPPTAEGPDRVPIYERSFGFGFSLVVEGRRGSAICSPATQAVCPPGESTLAVGAAPDLQVQVTRPLGDGSAAVCDDGGGEPPLFGGVPAIDPPRLEDAAAIADALNDFGCRFVDGTGLPTARRCNLACVRFEDGEFDCVEDTTEVQFCAPIPQPVQFPAGDTTVSVRLRDAGGNLGPVAQMIIRVTPP